MSLIRVIREKHARTSSTLITLGSLLLSHFIYASEPVGYINGSLSVDKGAANYSIPIAVPPGRAGMEPSLSIGYNSMSGSGLLGHGWNLNGLSAITRCGSSLVQDGKNRGVKLDSKDNYCLDGQRLIPIKGVNGADKTEYRTEIDSFSRIVSYGVAGTGPAKFKAWSKAGLITEYAFTEDSRGQAQGKESVLNYYVNLISDTTGKNHIKFNYIENAANTEINISSIEYGPNYRNKVLFTLGNISKDEIGAGYKLAGSLIKATKRINKIETFVDEELVQSYNPTYIKPKDKPSRLISINSCDNSGNCLKPITFDWVDTPDSSYLFYNYQNLATITTNTNPGVLVGDFNADGAKDLVIGNKIYQIKNKNLIKIADIPNTNCHRNSNNLVYVASSKEVFDNSIKPLRCAFEDMNKDGKADIIKVQSGKIYVALSNGNSLGSFKVWGTTSAKGLISIADINGDSYNDIFFSTVYQRIPYIWAHKSGDKERVKVENRYPGDLLLGNGNNFYRNSSFKNTAKLSECENCFITDINGDGYADIIKNNTWSGMFITSSIYTALSNGEQFNSFRKNSTEGWKGWNGSYYFQTYDVNGDGSKDLVASKPDRFSVALSGGETLNHGKKAGVQCNLKCVLVDVNNDGLPDLLKWTVSGNKTTFHVAPQKVPGELQLARIHNNVTTEIEYSDIHDNSIYTITNDFNYPDIPYRGRLTLVKSIISEIGNSNKAKTSYRYHGALINQKGRGSLGFKWIEEKDHFKGLNTITHFNQAYPYIGQVTKQETRLNSNNRVLNRTTNSFKTINLGKTKFPYTHTSTEQKYTLSGVLLTTSRITNDNYDRFGNLLSSKATTSGKGESFSVITTNRYSNYIGSANFITQNDAQTYGYNIPNSSRYLLGRLIQTTARHTAPNAPTKERVSNYSYNTTTGLLNKEHIEPSNAKSIINKSYHDTYGNVIRKEVTSQGKTRTSQTVFDSRGQFPVKQINTLGHSATASYEPKYGNITQTKDANGLISKTSYDGFGNPTVTIHPNGKTSRVNRKWSTECWHSVQNAAYCTEALADGSAPVYTYYDRFDREIRKITKGLKGSDIYRDTEYNAKGLVSRVSRAYHPGDRKYWATSQYDILDRVIQLTEPAFNGQTAVTKTQYNGFKTTVIDPTGAKKTTHTNAQGKITLIEEPLGAKVAYTYDALGNLSQTRDNKGNTTTVTYDIFGNKIKLDDPDMGVWSYEYNGFGELIKQTDAKKQVTTLAYDNLSRMTTRTMAGKSDKWVYDTLKKGLMTSHLGHNGDTASFSYNSLGQTTKVTKKLSGKTFTLKTEYDNWGRLSKEIRPNNFQLEYEYDSLGFLMAVKGLKSQTGSYPTTKLNTLINTAADKSAELQKEAERLINLADSFYSLADNYFNQLKDTTAAAINVPSALRNKLKSGNSYNIYKNGTTKYIRLADESVESNTVPFVMIGFNQYSVPIALPGHSFLKVNNDGTLSSVSSSESKTLFNTAVKTSSQVLIKDYNSDGKLEIALGNNFSTAQRQQIQIVAKEFDDVAALLYRQAAQLITSSEAILTLAESTYRQAKLAENWAESPTILTSELDLSNMGAATQTLNIEIPDTYKASYEKLKNSAGYIYYWQAKEADAEGRITRELLGNGLSNVYNYDPTNGLLLNSQTGFAGFNKIRDLKYQYNLINSVTKRIDLVNGAEESFKYDSLDRLLESKTTSKINGQSISQAKKYTYDTLGNITSKTGQGSYTYGSNRPHAVTKVGNTTYTYDNNGNMLTGAGRTLTWSAFNKPTKVVKDGKTVAFKYDANQSRYERKDSNGTTLYFDKIYEQITKGSEVTQKQFIYAGGALVATNISGKKADGSTKPTQTRYLHRDNLGSVDTITDQLANVVEKSSFDPFGSRRLTDWRVAQAGINLIPILTNRGFTGHEHMDDVGLIHMNGRVYDSELGRFLSADPHIQSPHATQSYNRYSYVMNNPLKYTDPSGYFLGKLGDAIKGFFKNKIFALALSIIVVAAIGPGVAAWAETYFASTLAAQATAGAILGFTGGIIASGGHIKAGLRGALIGGVSGMIGGGIDSFEGKVLAHGVVGGITSKSQGGKFASGFFSSAFAKITTGAVNGIKNANVAVKAMAQGIIGGTVSVIGGGKFRNAALTTSFQYLLNSELSKNIAQKGSLKETEAQRELRLAGDVEGYYAARAAAGDKYAARALMVVQNEYGCCSAEKLDKSVMALANFGLHGTAFINGVDVSARDVQLRLMNAHADFVANDNQGVPGLLNPRQIAVYHHQVFGQLGLPRATFGGTPVTGLVWEADVWSGIWCKGCDTQ